MNANDFEKYEGLIFDCDGTLADSMPVHFVAWRETLMRWGIEFDEDRFYSMGGMPSTKIVALLAKERGLEVDAQHVAEQKELYFQSLIDQVRPLAAVCEIAAAFHGRKPMAVASGSGRVVVEKQLVALKIDRWFAAVVTAEDTIRHKPEPDVFLEAARRIGVDPTKCVVFEDSPLGFQAAQAAGMDWVDVRTDPCSSANFKAHPGPNHTGANPPLPDPGMLFFGTQGLSHDDFFDARNISKHTHSDGNKACSDMTPRDINRSDSPLFDAGKLLPGCSIPIPAGEGSVHAFAEFIPLPLDGLSATARRSIADSLTEVARSLKQLHDSGYCDGRITSNSFHNRGSFSEPAATLWIDPSGARSTHGNAANAGSDSGKHIDTDEHRPSDIHRGDPESMYWTESRLQSGAAAQSVDDWYSIAVVIAELLLSSSAVHKIWELSRQDGKFVDHLTRNLKRVKTDKPLARTAIKLLQQTASGKLDDATIRTLFDRAPSHGLNPAWLLVIVLCVLLPCGVAVYYANRLADIHSGHDQDQQQIAALQSEVDQLTQRAAELQRDNVLLSSLAIPATSVRPNPSSVSQRNDRQRWADAVAGRELDEAIVAARDLQPAAWGDTLLRVQSLPGQTQWRIHDVKLRRLVQSLIDAPWDLNQFSEIQERVAALDEAYGRWVEWSRSRRSIDELKTQHELMASGLVKEFLGQWLAESLEVRAMDLTVRAIQCAADNTYLSHRIGYETPTRSDSLDWVWQSTAGSDESIQLKIDEYRTGESFSFWIQQDSSIPYWDSTVIEHTFDGPLLVWQLAKGLKLENKDSGYVVLLTTDHLYGPPVKLEGQRQSTPTPVERKVVDPMEELPFGLR